MSSSARVQAESYGRALSASFLLPVASVILSGIAVGETHGNGVAIWHLVLVTMIGF